MEKEVFEAEKKDELKRAVISAILLALCIVFQFSVSSGTTRLYVLIGACCIWVGISAVKNRLNLIKPDIICALLALAFTLSIRMNFDLIAFCGDSFLAFIKKAYVLFFPVWYIFFRSIRLCGWKQLCGKRLVESRHLSPVQLAMLVLLFGFILALAYRPFFPYGTSYDVFNQAAQIDGTLRYNRVHAIGHTIFLKALLSIYNNLAVVVIFQTSMVVLLYILFADFFYQKGLPLYLIVFFQGLALTFICNSTEAFFMPWKDTPAAVCLGFVALAFIKYLDRGTMSRRSAVGLGFGLAWCYLFRLNGIVALIFCGGYICISLLKKRLYSQTALILAVIAVNIIAVNAYADNVLHAENRENGFSIQVFGSGIAAMVNEGNLTDEELAEIDEILPVDWMKGRDMRTLIWDRDNSPRIRADENMLVYNNDYVLRMGENKKDVILLYFKLLPGHLLTCIRDVMDNTGIVWTLMESFFISNYIFQFAILLLAADSNRLRGAEWIPFLPSLCNTVSIMISTTTNETRYLLPTFLLAPCLILYSVWRGRSKEADSEQ